MKVGSRSGVIHIRWSHNRGVSCVHCKAVNLGWGASGFVVQSGSAWLLVIQLVHRHHTDTALATKSFDEQRTRPNMLGW